MSRHDGPSDQPDDEDETDFWLAVPDLRESLIEADADYAAGRTFGEDEIRARYGLPKRINISVPDSFDDPLPESEIALWEGQPTAEDTSRPDRNE
ncbi:hypothetical protein MOKP125_02610 [Mycobacterium avium subsp. hominissuis]